MLPVQCSHDCSVDVTRREALMDSGWKAADLHVHTSFSHDVLPRPELHPEALLAKARERGLSFVSFTDHDTMDAYEVVGYEREGLIPGVEISITDRERVGHTVHVNVYTLRRRQCDELLLIARRARRIETLIAYLRAEGLPYVFNHPFWAAPEETLRPGAVESLIPLFPVVEHNMKRIRPLNALALALAARHGKGVVASSDSHIGEVGESCTLAQGEAFPQWFANVAAGRAFLQARDLGFERLTAEIAFWRDHLFTAREPLGPRCGFTGLWAVDALMRFFASQASTGEIPLLTPVLKSLMRQLIDSGLPSLLYLRGQVHAARRLVEAYGWENELSLAVEKSRQTLPRLEAQVFEQPCELALSVGMAIAS